MRGRLEATLLDLHSDSWWVSPSATRASAYPSHSEL